MNFCSPCRTTTFFRVRKCSSQEPLVRPYCDPSFRHVTACGARKTREHKVPTSETFADGMQMGNFSCGEEEARVQANMATTKRCGPKCCAPSQTSSNQISPRAQKRLWQFMAKSGDFQCLSCSGTEMKTFHKREESLASEVQLKRSPAFGFLQRFCPRCEFCACSAEIFLLSSGVFVTFSFLGGWDFKDEPV